MIKPISAITPKAKLFCQQYWERTIKNAKSITSNSVSQHTLLYDVNLTLLRRNFSTSLSTFGAERVIRRCDKEFKLLKPLEEGLTLWRGISQPKGKNAKYIKEFMHSYNVKPGEIIHMREYAYATTSRKGAEVYTKSNYRSILYEIDVPKGSRISYSFNHIFPRYSKFECTGVNEIINENSVQKIIKLKYLNQ